MKGYSENEIFPQDQITALRRAARLVQALPDIEDLRCHELAHAMGRYLELPIQDGLYGFVDHSWLWTATPILVFGRVGFPNILDVYCVGRLPQVQLIDGKHTQLPHVGWAYRTGPTRDDIDSEVVLRLLGLFRESEVKLGK